MRAELLSILQHSLGVDQYGRGNHYRNHYAVGPGQSGFEDCVELVRLGLMEDHGSQAMWGGMHGFSVTYMGKEAMEKESPMPPKLSRAAERYKAFLRADCGMSFIDWLRASAREGYR